MKLILASESEWRKRLLSWMQIAFETRVSGVDETQYTTEDADELVAMLATAKAEKVAEPFKGDDGEQVLVVGADTVIAFQGVIIGKPTDRQHARDMIGMLQGRTHDVYTGVCVINVATGERRVEVEVSQVTFDQMSEIEIERYLDTKQWQGKAGGYQILGAISPYVKQVKENVTNVIGLPLGLLQQMFAELGIDVEVSLRQVIEQETGYES